MKKVCVNRLTEQAKQLQHFANSMEHQEPTFERLFQCILELFENEWSHGHAGSVMTHGNAATNGFLNSQTDSIFNSKHNLQLSEVDSNIGMSFGRATEDGLQVKSLNKLAATNNMPSLSMNRQLKSDRNVFNA